LPDGFPINVLDWQSRRYLVRPISAGLYHDDKRLPQDVLVDLDVAFGDVD